MQLLTALNRNWNLLYKSYKIQFHSSELNLLPRDKNRKKEREESRKVTTFFTCTGQIDLTQFNKKYYGLLLDSKRVKGMRFKKNFHVCNRYRFSV